MAENISELLKNEKEGAALQFSINGQVTIAMNWELFSCLIPNCMVIQDLVLGPLATLK